jgi:hypothetical protein
VFLIFEVSLYFGIIDYWILISSIKFSKFTYLGIFPGILIIFLASLFTIYSLVKNSQTWKDLVIRIGRASFQEYFIFIVSVLGLSLLGAYLGDHLMTNLEPVLGSIADIELVNSIVILSIVNFFIDLVYFLLTLFQRWNEKYLSARLKKLLPERQTIFTNSISPALLSFIGAFVLFAVILLFFKIGYDVNDDIYMTQILSGYYSGSPVQFPIYSNVLVGLLYQLLFQINSRVNWVTIFYLVVNFLSVWNLFDNIFRLKQKKALTIFYVAVVIAFESYILVTITFTTIAAVACVSGLISLINTLLSNKNIWKFQLFSGIGLLLIGNLIRPSTVILVMIPFVPFFLLSLKKIFSKRNIAPILLTGSIIGIAFLFNIVYLHYYPDWESFQRYTNTRALVQDTPRMFTINDEAKLTDLVGWSSNDYLLFNNWFSLDKNVYSESNLKILGSNFSNWFKDVPTAYYFYKSQILIFPIIDLIYIVISTWFAVILFTQKRRTILLSSFAYIYLNFVGFFMVWGYKMPQRIIIPALFTQALINIFLPNWSMDNDNNDENLQPKKMNIFSNSILLLTFISLILGWKIFAKPFQLESTLSERQTEYSNYLDSLDKLVDNGTINKNSVIISCGAGIPFEYMSPLQPLELPKAKVVVSGWNTFSPAYEKALQNAGISDDPLMVSDHKNLYLLTPEKLIPAEIKFYLEHYNMNLKPKIVYKFNFGTSATKGNSLVIYQLIR